MIDAKGMAGAIQRAIRKDQMLNMWWPAAESIEVAWGHVRVSLLGEGDWKEVTKVKQENHIERNGRLH